MTQCVEALSSWQQLHNNASKQIPIPTAARSRWKSTLLCSCAVLVLLRQHASSSFLVSTASMVWQEAGDASRANSGISCDRSSASSSVLQVRSSMSASFITAAIMLTDTQQYHSAHVVPCKCINSSVTTSLESDLGQRETRKKKTLPTYYSLTLYWYSILL
jgi:hypothetical protein